MKHGKLYWLSVVATMLIAVGCDESSTSTICTDNTWNCDDNVLYQCVSGNWKSVKKCHEGTTCNQGAAACIEDETRDAQCLANEHIFAEQCEPDDVNHCGSHFNDCAKMAGWKSGKCIDKTCIAIECTTGYHLANRTNADSKAIAICDEDTHDACGSANMKCDADQICTQGVCSKSCVDGYHLYENTCEADSLEHCGAHGNACNIEGATNICANGKCSSTCKEGYGELNGSCLPAMISTWEVTSNNLNLAFPIQGRAGAIVIDWGDGTRSEIDSGDAAYISHAYLNTGIYVITVFGTIEKWSCSYDEKVLIICDNNRKACDGLISIRSFGNVTFGRCAFAYTPKLESFPAKGTVKFYDNDASYAFYRSSFNNDISGWDTSSITNMSHMFRGASAFNQPIENWDVSSVTDMSYMFAVTYMDAPFNQYVPSSSVFNQPLNNWNVSNVTNMSYMFWQAKAFNQPLENWDVSNVTDMDGMFAGASAFNQPLENWDVSNVINMNSMFDAEKTSQLPSDTYQSIAPAFNQPLNNWDVSNVISMSYMFRGASAFDQPLNNWNVSNVTNMSYMFRDASAFNQPLENWNVSNVTDMSYMFEKAEAFNQPLNNWNVSNVTNMCAMFMDASAFNQPLNNWGVSYAYKYYLMFSDSGLSQENYCKTVEGQYSYQGPKYDLGLEYVCNP